MLGAILGDMVGSKYEFHPIKRKEFDIFDEDMKMTDDSYLTLAVAKVLLKHYPLDYQDKTLKMIQEDLAKEFIKEWKYNRGAGYGGMFYEWCYKSDLLEKPAPPYNSFGNGSAMRISPVAWIVNTEEELKLLSKAVTEITHNHPEGIKGAEATAMCIYLALHGARKEEIKERMINEYYPEIATLDFDDLVKTYAFSEICQKTVPQAIYCFLISNSLEDTLRNCVAIGGDCDTTGAIAGAIAEAYYQKDTLSEFENMYLYLKIEPHIEKFLKEFYKTINNKKFENKK